MTRPYYADEHVTLYHGDCREITGWLGADTLITDPPYPNRAGYFTEDIPEAEEALAMWGRRDALVFWSELAPPPVTAPLVAVHIWHRNNVNGRPYEPCYHHARDGTKRRSLVLSHPMIHSGVGPGSSEYVGHPTQKPVAIMRRLIELTRGTIADPFAGSGATLVAAKYQGRRAIGVERDESYCEAAARRLTQESLALPDDLDPPGEQLAFPV